METENLIQLLEKEAKKCKEYALKCHSNSVQEHWFGQLNGFKKAIKIIRDNTNEK
jgi:hypothetical protein